MDNGVHDAQRLKELQALPLNRKIQITQTRIIEWYQHFKGQVCVSFSGGKDSTVLMDIARRIYPDIPAVFSNTGLEYPEPYVNGGCKDAHGNYRRFQGRKERDPLTRAKTFPGIAAAMASQWGGDIR